MKNRVKPGDTWDFRPGMTSPHGVHPGWTGIMPDADPSTTPFNKLVVGLNVRFEAGQVRNRWGFKQVCALPEPYYGQRALTGGNAESIQWLGSHHMQFKAPLLWILEETEGAAGSWVGTCTVRYFNPDSDPQVRQTGVAGSDSGIHGIGTYGGDMHLYAAQKLYKLAPFPDSAITDGQAGILLAGSPLSALDANCLQEFNGVLYGGSKVTWDGISVAETGLGLAECINSCVWRDAMLVGVSNGSTTYYCIDTGGTAYSGTMATQMDNPYKNSMVEFRDLVYVATGDTDIIAITPGTTPTSAVAHSCPANSKVMALAVLGDVLYYLYRIADGLESDTYLGMYEPDASSGNWIDAYKSLDTELDAEWGGEAPWPTTMAAYRNRLVIGTLGGGATHQKAMDPTSTWYQLYTSSSPTVALKVGG